MIELFILLGAIVLMGTIAIGVIDLVRRVIPARRAEVEMQRHSASSRALGAWNREREQRAEREKAKVVNVERRQSTLQKKEQRLLRNIEQKAEAARSKEEERSAMLQEKEQRISENEARRAAAVEERRKRAIEVAEQRRAAARALKEERQKLAPKNDN